MAIMTAISADISTGWLSGCAYKRVKEKHNNTNEQHVLLRLLFIQDPPCLKS
jgi:hypothetical protein